MLNRTAFHRNVLTGSAAALAAGALALGACAPYQSPPQEVQASNPTVTYNYAGEEQLVAANGRAVGHCARFDAVPTTTSIVDNADGTKSVTFECTPGPRPSAGPVLAPAPAAPNMTYTFTTDRQLLEASQSANIWCRSQNRQAVTATITPNANGTKTVTFQCVPA